MSNKLVQTRRGYVRIKKATLNDRFEIFSFIKREWSSNHVFLNFPKLFDWQHSGDNFVNFIIGHDKFGVRGILGYIPSTHWSGEPGPSSVSLAIWKVSNLNPHPGLGVHLLNKLIAIESPQRVEAIGVSESAIEIYKMLGFQTGIMSHYAVGPYVTPREESVAKDANSHSKFRFASSRLELKEDIGKLRDIAYSEFRNSKYVVERYMKHPCYSYEVFYWNKDGLSLATIHREITYDETILSRIVDVIGDRSMLPSLGAELHELAVERGWDYIDLVCFGHDPDKMEHGGFVDRFKFPDLVLPHHFEPFENKNVDLAFAVKSYSGSGPGYLYLADSDQDRPNKLPEEIESE